jgi:CBS domain-containing protein
MLRVQDFMTTPIETIAPGATADLAFETMQRKGIHHLVVADRTGPLGVLSHRDIGGRQGEVVRRNRTVTDLMSPSLVTVPPTATARQAANLMRGRSIGCLVVADGGKAVGIVTVSDLLTLIGQGLERTVVSTKRPALRHTAPHRKQARSGAAW